MNLRQINRLMPLPPATVTDPLPEGAPIPSDRSMAEDWQDALAVLEQRLSLDLAHLYQRNVVCVGGLAVNARQEQHDPGGRKLSGQGAPAAGYIRTGKYLWMGVSIEMARHLLRRDGGSSGP